MDQDIFGRYIHRKKRSNYIELKPDGNYFLFEGSSGVTGLYEVNGTQITIFGAESASQGRIQDGVIIEAPAKSLFEFPWELIEAGWIVIIFILLMFTRP